MDGVGLRQVAWCDLRVKEGNAVLLAGSKETLRGRDDSVSHGAERTASLASDNGDFYHQSRARGGEPVALV